MSLPGLFGEHVQRMDRAAVEHLGGVEVTYQPADGPAVTVTGIFQVQYVLAQGDAEAGVETLAPTLFVQVADLPADPMVDDPTLTIGGIVYRVIERQPDDAGAIKLVLGQVR